MNTKDYFSQYTAEMLKEYGYPQTSHCKYIEKIDGDPNDPHAAVSISAPSIIDAIAGYYCDNYWFGSAPDETEMLCGGSEYESVYRK